jgi:SAM-dependent methyltransferase
MAEHGQTVNRHYGVAGLSARILDSLRRAGKNPDSVTRDDLALFDEFHTGGRASTRELARLAGISPGERVLDVGSGVGGPARTLAAEFRCFVVGLDLTAEFCRAAALLTGLVKLAGHAAFVQADALALPFPDASFHVVWSQNTIMNIADKGALFREIRRVLRPGGRFALEAALKGPVPGIHYPTFWASSAELNHLATPEEARAILAEAGFAEEAWEDRTEPSLEQARKRRASMLWNPMGGLGREVIVAEKVAEKSENSIRNSEERRVLPVRAVLRRTG